MHALSSAAVAMAVTRGCSRGELERCGCDRKVRGVSPEGESKEPSGILYRETSSALFHRERLGTRLPGRWQSRRMSSFSEQPFFGHSGSPFLTEALLCQNCNTSKYTKHNIERCVVTLNLLYRVPVVRLQRQPLLRCGLLPDIRR